MIIVIDYDKTNYNYHKKIGVVSITRLSKLLNALYHGRKAYFYRIK